MTRGRDNPTRTDGGRDRGQVVLVAAVALAVALVPLLLAYLQLGYSGDVRSGSTIGPGTETTRTLDRGLQSATADIPALYGWGERERAAGAVRGRMNSTIAGIEQSRLADGTALGVTYNESRTAAWLAANCPDGPDRQFGACRVVDGIAVQERSGQTHVLGAAFDIAVTTDDTDLQFTAVVGT